MSSTELAWCLWFSLAGAGWAWSSVGARPGEGKDRRRGKGIHEERRDSACQEASALATVAEAQMKSPFSPWWS